MTVPAARTRSRVDPLLVARLRTAPYVAAGLTAGIGAVSLLLLGKAGLTVVVARNGREALAMATALIRRLPGWESIPFIAMTAHAFIEDRPNCLDAGMNDHLAKPVATDAQATPCN
jgi:CheY-like chemotaxis protein